jgi:hypothetical protein
MLKISDSCTVRDLLEMLISLPVNPSLRWRNRWNDGCHPCDLAREIYVDLTEECNRLYREREEFKTKMEQYFAYARKMEALLDHERETHPKIVAEFEKTILEERALIAKQQQIINKEITHEKTK